MKRLTAFIGSLGGGGAQGVFVTVINYYAQLGYEINAVINTLANDVHSEELDKRIKIIDLKAQSAQKSLALNTDWNYSHVKETAKRFQKECILPQYKEVLIKAE